jgi:hypothetical protein
VRGSCTTSRSRTPAVVVVTRRSTGYVSKRAGGIFTIAMPQMPHLPATSARWSGCIGQ